MIASDRSPNRARLMRTAHRLTPYLSELVFVGGQMTELLVTDPASIRPRPTDDVDVVVRVTTRTEYHRFQTRLRDIGFMPDARPGAPICRMRTADDLVLDVMPLDEGILGFTNRWYPLALDTAARIELEPGLSIRAITAPVFLATKWEAYRARGAADPMTSHDLEDIITVVMGRSALAQEIGMLPPEAHRFIAGAVRDFLAEPWAEEIIMGNIPDARGLPGIADVVLARFRMLAKS